MKPNHNLPAFLDPDSDNLMLLGIATKLLNEVYPENSVFENATIASFRDKVLSQLDKAKISTLTSKSREELQYFIRQLASLVDQSKFQSPSSGSSKVYHIDSNIRLEQNAELHNVTIVIETLIYQAGTASQNTNAPHNAASLTVKLVKKAHDILIATYSPWHIVKGLFGEDTKLKQEYVHLEFLVDTQKLQKAKENKEQEDYRKKKESKNTLTTATTTKLSSHDDLFGTKRAMSVENLFKADREFFSSEELKELNNANTIPRTVLIQGPAGRGKTTLAKYLAYCWTLKNQSHSNTSDLDVSLGTQMPLLTEFDWVFVLLIRHLNGKGFKQASQLTLREWVYLSLFKKLDFDEGDFKHLWKDSIEPALKQNKALIILEGLDEEPAEHGCKEVLTLLKTGAYAQYSKLITSRPHATEGLLKDRNIEVSGFNDLGIQYFIKQYFAKQLSFTQSFIQLFQQNSVLWANARLPLSLNILCWIMSKQGKPQQDDSQIELPAAFQTMAGLYEAMLIELLVRGYKSERRVNPELTELSAKYKKVKEQTLFNYYKTALSCLESIAYLGMVASESNLISSETVAQAFLQCQSENPDMDINLMSKQLYRLGILRPILVDQEGNPLLEENQADEFLHYTFQEFFAGRYIAKKLSSSLPEQQVMQRFVLEEKLNPRYEIVFWFLAGLSKTADSQQTLIQLFQGEPGLVRTLYPTANHTISLYKDIFGHYELSLLARCADEWVLGSTANEPWVNAILEKIQDIIVTHYEIWEAMDKEQIDFLGPELLLPPWLTPLRLCNNLLKQTGTRDLCFKLITNHSASNQINQEHLQEYIEHVTLSTSVVLEFLLARLNNPEEQSTAIATLGKLGAVAGTSTSQVIAALLPLLSSQNEDVQRKTAYALSQLGTVAATPQIFAALIPLLSSQDEGVQANAAHALIQLGTVATTPQIIAALLPLLSSQNEDVQRKTAGACSLLGTVAATPQVITALLPLLSSQNNYVQMNAASALGELGTVAATPQIIDGLLPLLSSQNMEVQMNAASALGKLGTVAATPQIIAALLPLLSSQNVDVRSNAADVLSKLGTVAATPQVIAGLLPLLSSQNKFIQSDAAHACCMLGTVAATPQVITALLSLLSSQNEGVQWSAANALGQLGTVATTPQIIAGLLPLLSSKNNYVQMNAASALGKLGTVAATPQVIAGLLPLLSSQNNAVQGSAVYALEQLGAVAATPQIIAALLPLLSSQNEGVQSTAAHACCLLGTVAATPQVITALLSLLSSQNEDVQSIAAHALGKLGTVAATPQVITALLPLLSSQNNDVQSGAAYALGQLGTVATTLQIIAALLPLLSSQNQGVQSSAANALRQLGTVAATPQIIAQLLPLLSSQNEDVQRKAESVLGHLGTVAETPQIIAGLLTLLSSANEDVQMNAANALGELGAVAATPQVIAGLLPLLSSKNLNVQMRAAHVLCQLGAFIAIPSLGMRNLIRLLSHEEWFVHEKSADPLCALETQAAKPSFLLPVYSLYLSSQASNIDSVFKVLFTTLRNHAFSLLKNWHEADLSNPLSHNAIIILTLFFQLQKLNGAARIQISQDAAKKSYALTSYCQQEKLHLTLSAQQLDLLQKYIMQLHSYQGASVNTKIDFPFWITKNFTFAKDVPVALFCLSPSNDTHHYELIDLSDLYFILQDFSKSLAYLDNWIQLEKSNEHSDIEACTYVAWKKYEIARKYIKLGQLNEAVPILESSIELFQSNQNKLESIISILQLAVLCRSLDVPSKANEHLSQVATILENGYQEINSLNEDTKKRLSVSYQNLADYYHVLVEKGYSEYVKDIGLYFMRSIELCERSDNHCQYALFLINQTNRHKNNRLNEAIAHLTIALEPDKDSGISYAYAERILLDSFLQQEVTLTTSLDISAKMLAQYLLIQCYLNNNDNTLVLKAAQELQQLVDEDPNPLHYRILSNAYTMVGDSSLAEKYRGLGNPQTQLSSTSTLIKEMDNCVTSALVTHGALFQPPSAAEQQLNVNTSTSTSVAAKK